MASPALRFDELELVARLEKAIAARERRLFKKLPPAAPPMSRRGTIPPSFATPYIKPSKVFTRVGQTTFHMAHSVITNAYTPGRKLRTMTEAAEAHDDYINRNGASEEFDLAATQGHGSTTDEFSELQRYSAYLDEGDIDVTRQGKMAFGTIGNSREERREFWRSVGAIERTPRSMPGVWIHTERNPGFWQAVLEMPRDLVPIELRDGAFKAIANGRGKFRIELEPDRIEVIDDWVRSIAKHVVGYESKLPSVAVSMPRGGRLQMRLIIELPHEVSAVGRYEIARNFCKIFEERGLPYWTVGHKPSPFGDERNFHLHIAYYDRPCKRLEDGTWDIQKTVVTRLDDGRYKTSRPLVPPKDRGAQGRDWMLALRHRYADEANKVLAREGAAKRYTPKSYAALGIKKTPGQHISQGAFNLERQGVATEEGKHNRMATLAWEQRNAREGQERTVRPILDEIDVGLARAADRSRSAANLDQLSQDICALQGILVGNSKRAALLSVEARSLGGYAAEAARFFGTLLEQLNRRPARPAASDRDSDEADAEFTRIASIRAVARQAANRAAFNRAERLSELQKLKEESDMAQEEAVRLLFQLDRAAASVVLSKPPRKIEVIHPSEPWSPPPIEMNELAARDDLGQEMQKVMDAVARSIAGEGPALIADGARRPKAEEADKALLQRRLLTPGVLPDSTRGSLPEKLSEAADRAQEAIKSLELPPQERGARR